MFRISHQKAILADQKNMETQAVEETVLNKPRMHIMKKKGICDEVKSTS